MILKRILSTFTELKLITETNFKILVAEDMNITFISDIKIPNKETLEAIKELENGGGYVCNSVDELFDSAKYRDHYLTGF